MSLFESDTLSEYIKSDRFKWFPFGYPYCNIEEYRRKVKRRKQRKENRKIKGHKHRNPKQ